MAELNAKVEDPDLWNDTERAQSLMRARQELDDQIARQTALEQELEDNVELLELGEARTISRSSRRPKAPS